MLTRMTAQLESIADGSIPTLTLSISQQIAIEVLVPAYLAQKLESQIGSTITLYTHLYLESQGQGTSFIPRVIGFASTEDRAFFELFTTVKGVGSKKALRAMVEPPSVIAASIMNKDSKSLVKLPEIGKRSAETIIAELAGKVERFAGDAIMNPDLSQPSRFIEHPSMPAAAIEAIAALMALGEQRSNAEQKVQLALTRVDPSADVDTIVSAVFAGG